MGNRLPRFSWHRRLVAIFAGAAVLAMSFEVVLPDIHDDDAVAAVVAAAPSGLEHSERPVPATPVSGHSFHVDHCSHGHPLATMEPAVSGGVALMGHRAIAALTVAPPAVFAPPRFRPPIA